MGVVCGRMVDRRDAVEWYICPFGGIVFNRIQTLPYRALVRLDDEI